MIININTDSNIQNTELLKDHITSVVTDQLKRYQDRISRVEVHLSDQNAHKKTGKDIKCTMEARPDGFDPMTVSEITENLHQSIKVATEKLVFKLQNEFERRRNY
jgi:ribosomal subunit interface protein